MLEADMTKDKLEVQRTFDPINIIGQRWKIIKLL